MNNIADIQLESFSNVYPAYYEHEGKRTAKTVTFVVTEDCTLRCSYCYECHKNKENRMSFETAKKCVDLMFEEDAKNTSIFGEDASSAVILDFIGGEPLLEIKLIDQIVEYFLKKAIELDHRWKTEYMISMISNGTQYFTDPVQDFIRKYDGRLSFSVTIDGNKQLHDSCRLFPDGSPSFDLAQAAYKDALNKGLCSATKMTIAPSNLPFLSEALKDLILYENASLLPANPVYEEEWTTEQASLYYEQLKDFALWNIENEVYKSKSTTLFERLYLGKKNDDDKNWCGGTCQMLAFAPNGDIYPCVRYLPFSLRNKDKREKMLLGHCDHGLLNDGLEKKRFKFLESITRTSQSVQKCNDCPISMGCGWCSGWNYDYFGTPNKRFTGICNMHKARVLANVLYWNLLYRKENMSDRFTMNVPKEWAIEIISEDEYNYLVELAGE